MSFGGSKSKAEEGIRSAGAEAYGRSRMTPEEEAQYKQSFETGNLLTQAERYRAGLGPMPANYIGEEQQYQNMGPLAQSYYGQALAGTKDPYAAWESSFQPQLQLAQDAINRQAQSRGLLRSGVPIEAMGRAGAELAIMEAQNRMNFRNQELNRGGQLSEFISGLGRQNLQDLQGLYSDQQRLGQGAMNRQAQAAWNNAQYQAYPSQAALGNYYGTQSGLMGGLGGLIGGVGGLALSGGNPAIGALGYNIGSGLAGGGAKNPMQLGNISSAPTGIPQNRYDYQVMQGQNQQSSRPTGMSYFADEDLASKYPWIPGKGA